MSIWERIYTHLKENGIDVYSPGQHQGECTTPFVVIKSDGVYPYNGISTNQAKYTMFCYVPGNKYSKLDPFVDHVEELLSELYPMLKSLNFRTPAFYDDTVKGHMISTQYINYVKR